MHIRILINIHKHIHTYTDTYKHARAHMLYRRTAKKQLRSIYTEDTP